VKYYVFSLQTEKMMDVHPVFYFNKSNISHGKFCLLFCGQHIILSQRKEQKPVSWHINLGNII